MTTPLWILAGVVLFIVMANVLVVSLLAMSARADILAGRAREQDELRSRRNNRTRGASTPGSMTDNR